MSPSTSTSATELLSRSPSEILFFVQQHWDRVKLDDELHWHAVAEIAATKANLANPSNVEIVLKWATVSVLVYDRLAENSDPAARQSFGLSAMNLRSNMIISLGPCPGHLALDPAVVENWFFREAGVTYAEVSSLVSTWQNLPVTEKFRLRNCK